ncbi:RNA-binding protein RO60-like [Glandiceps talaboti]
MSEALSGVWNYLTGARGADSSSSSSAAAMDTSSSTHQSKKARVDQVVNSAGGYVWEVSDMNRLRRFLCLGSEGGTFYIGEKELGRQNAECIQRMIENGDGEKVVEEIKTFSVQGRAAKQNPIIFALALCARDSNKKAKRAAYNVLNDVCRIPTHLFSFIEFSESLSKGTGWGRAHRTAIQNWYKRKNGKQLALAVTKYRNRNGWTHRDVLRLAHIKPHKKATAAVFKYVIKGLKVTKEEYCKETDDGGDADTDEAEKKEVSDVIEFLSAVEEAKVTKDEQQMVQLIEKHRLVREHIPTEFLKSSQIWKALLQEMPMTAMLRNLGKMSSIDLLKSDSDELSTVLARLQNDVLIKSSRIHPFSVLIALSTYRTGRGDKGKLKWDVNMEVCNALDAAFYKSFKNVEPTGQRFMLALDVSGSMSSPIMGARTVSAHTGAAAMAMTTAKTEANYHMVAFSHKMVPININANMKLDDVLTEMVRIPMGATDCALPMIHALEKNIPIDVFIVYTDCETWFGEMHPFQALRKYREKMDIPAKLIVCGMTSTGFTIADPSDAGMMDMAGFDAAAPEVIRNFAIGNI